MSPLVGNQVGPVYATGWGGIKGREFQSASQHVIPAEAGIQIDFYLIENKQVNNDLDSWSRSRLPGMTIGGWITKEVILLKKKGAPTSVRPFRFLS